MELKGAGRIGDFNFVIHVGLWIDGLQTDSLIRFPHVERLDFGNHHLSRRQIN